ncbi:MAG: M15 family metallopeptidase [Hamadaea sp.]|uniref:M15 family metallopeptidase n=1 Tax=Hamadaea sp. TaxID=2024425 RepID=UPI0018204C5C|nr:M15 family metallopeptidase [Hamadaea sp.]NUR71786.1 M15 family metallopeptidase [Hamadaea sp.]NUT23914.1 M15 family metallopeptidase [Hamadaea sp.]
MILLSDRRVRELPVADNGEALVDVRTVDGLRVDHRLADPLGAYALLREGVIDRLLTAQRRLPDGVRLLIVEGYRPLSLQAAYFGEYAGKLRQAHPEWDAERVHVEASKYISPPEVAPHSTGGTVDLTLCAEDGTELDLGTPINATPLESADRCFTAATDIPSAARSARSTLGTALTSVGMINYPTEWWHWSFGDRYWALQSGAGRTCYGPVDLAAALTPSSALSLAPSLALSLALDQGSGSNHGARSDPEP